METEAYQPPAAIEAGASASRRPRRRGPAAVDAQVVAAGLLAATVGASMLAVGAVHLPVLVLVAGIGFASAAVALHKHALGRDGLVIPLPALICAALALYTLLQAAPLPARLLQLIAPTAADVWERSLLPFGEAGPRWASLSLDPGASVVEALKWMLYASVFTAASTVSAHHGAEWGLRIVAGSALVAALVTVAHAATGATSLYGLYKPSMAFAHIGPLLNSNNLAGYLNLGALCGLGLMLGQRPVIPRWVYGLGAALIVGVEVTIASRAGVASLVLGVALLGVLSRKRGGDERRDRGNASTWILLAAVAGGMTLAILASTHDTWAELYDKDLSKLTMGLWVRPMVRDFPLFGVGRGAFESAFPAYRTVPGSGFNVFTHPENFVVQWIAEWGVPVGLAALATFAWAFAPRRLGVLRSKTAAGAWCGAIALLAQNLLDLAFEIPAVMIALAVVLGSLWGDRQRARRSDALRLSGPLAPRPALLAAVGVGTAGAVLGVSALAFGRDDVGADRETAHELAEASSPDARRFLHAAISRHPAEPFFALVGATLAFRAANESPIPWIERSLERGQVNGRAHLLLAQVLARRGNRRQAVLELRFACDDDAALAGPAAALAARWARSFDDLLTAVPEGKAGTVMLSQLGGVLRASSAPGEVELGRACDVEAIHRDPGVIPPRAREVQAVLADLTAPPGAAARCVDRTFCRQQILEHARAIAAVAPTSAMPSVFEARLLLAEGKPEEAAALLETACETVDDRKGCLRERVNAAASVKAPGLLDRASKDLLAAACSTPAECGDTAALLAEVRQGRGESGMALALLSRAAREDPNNDARWLGLADAASAAGAHGEAVIALERVARKHGGADPALSQRIAAERARVSNAVLLKPR